MCKVVESALAAILATTALGSNRAEAELLTGVSTTNVLETFDSATPGTIIASVSVTGLQGGENLLAIDFRPANGVLYGLGSTSRLYTINPTTGAASQVGVAGAITLSGTAFGFDFNPIADRGPRHQHLRPEPAAQPERRHAHRDRPFSGLRRGRLQRRRVVFEQRQRGGHDNAVRPRLQPRHPDDPEPAQ
jgi:Domain of unknown function (DUF4394)